MDAGTFFLLVVALIAVKFLFDAIRIHVEVDEFEERNDD